MTSHNGLAADMPARSSRGIIRIPHILRLPLVSLSPGVAFVLFLAEFSWLVSVQVSGGSYVHSYINALAYLGLGGIGAIRLITGTRRFTRPLPMYVTEILFLFFLCWAALLSIQTSFALKSVATSVCSIALLIYVSSLRIDAGDDRKRLLLDAVYFSILVLLVLSALSYILLPRSMTVGMVGDTMRFHGILRHPNGLGRISSIMVFLLLFDRIPARRKAGAPAAHLYGLLVLAIVLLVMTNSRTSIILTLGITFIVWLLGGTPSMTRAIFLTSCVLASILLFMTFYPYVAKKIEDNKPLREKLQFAEGLTRHGNIEEFILMSGRFEIWRNAATLVRKRPLIGYGYNTGVLDVGNAHNMYLETAVSTGVPGLAVIVIILLGALFTNLGLFVTTGEPLARIRYIITLFLILVGIATKSLVGSTSIPFILFCCILADTKYALLRMSRSASSRAVHARDDNRP